MKLENEIAWAQVEDFEKKALIALKIKENQMAEIERVCFNFVIVSNKKFTSFLPSASKTT